jgi:hypothetical protein
MRTLQSFETSQVDPRRIKRMNTSLDLPYLISRKDGSRDSFLKLTSPSSPRRNL